MAIKALREKRVKLVFDSRVILDTASAANRDLTAEEDANFVKINGEIDALGKQIERLERQESIENGLKLILDPARLRELNPASAAGSKPAGEKDKDQVPVDQAQALAFNGWGRVQNGIRPLKKQIAAAKQLGIRLSGRYFDFEVGPNFASLRKQFFNAMSLTAASGGYTVPQGFVHALEAAMLYFGPMMQVADVLRTASGNTLPWPTVNDTGNTGALLAEATTVGSSVDPVFAQVSLGAYKFSSKLVQVSAELLEDSDFDLAEMLAAALGERMGRVMNTYFTTGTGSSQPKGVVVAATLGKTAASATAIAADEIIDLEFSVDRAYRDKGSYMSHDNIRLALRKLKDTTNQYLWQPSYQKGTPDQLNGHDYLANGDMASAITTTQKTLLFGQFSKYKVRQVRKVRIRRLVERYADTDQEGFVGFTRADGNLLDAGVAPVKYLQQA